MPDVFAVLGHPISHSLSPFLHGGAFRHLRMTADYTAIDVPPEAFARTLRGLGARGIRGANVTIPLKEEAFALTYPGDDTARRIGAVNVLVYRQGSWWGYNTDAPAFMAALPRPSERALVLGAGGAARAVLHGLVRAGTAVAVSVRRDEAARSLRAALGVDTVPWDERHERLGAVDLVVNATPLGTGGKGCPLDSLHGSRRGVVVYDLVYRPLRTPLLAMAEAEGLETVSGVSMLAKQAALSWLPWFGVQGPAEAFERRLRALLAAEAAEGR